MPSPLKKFRIGRKQILAYKRKDAGRHIKKRGRKYQIYSRRKDQARQSHARPRGFRYAHTGDIGGMEGIKTDGRRLHI